MLGWFANRLSACLAGMKFRIFVIYLHSKGLNPLRCEAFYIFKMLTKHLTMALLWFRNISSWTSGPQHLPDGTPMGHSNAYLEWQASESESDAALLKSLMQRSVTITISASSSSLRPATETSKPSAADERNKKHQGARGAS